MLRSLTEALPKVSLLAALEDFKNPACLSDLIGLDSAIRADQLINALIAAFGSTMNWLTQIANALLAPGFSAARVIASMVPNGWVVPVNWP